MAVLSSRWLKVGISVGLFVLLLRAADLRTLIQQVGAARTDLFLLAFGGYLISQVFCAYKWQILARPLGFQQSFGAFVTYYFIGMYLNLFVPSTVVGDVGRGLLLARSGGRMGPALQSVVADRASGMVMLMWVSACGFLLFGPTVLPTVLCYGTIITACLPIGGWWLLPHLIARIGSPQGKIRLFAERVLAPYRTQGAAALNWACVLSFVFHLFQLGLQVILARALGLVVPFWYLMLFIPLVHMLSALPLSFGGVGVREGSYVVFLALIGINKDAAIAFGLLWTALVFGSGLVGGLVLLASPTARLSLVNVRKTTDE